MRGLLVLLAIVLVAPTAYADGGAETLDLDAEEVDAAPTPDFTIPIKVNGQQVECGYWKGQDPADVAIEFGSLHQLDGKKISRLRKAIAAEAETRGLLAEAPAPASEPASAPSQLVPADAAAPAESPKRPGAHALSITRFQDKWAKMQVATIQFAHSPFCQKFCTRENAGVMGIAVSIAIFNACWAMLVSPCLPAPATSTPALTLADAVCSDTSGARMPLRRSSSGWKRKRRCAERSRKRCSLTVSQRLRQRLWPGLSPTRSRISERRRLRHRRTLATCRRSNGAGRNGAIAGR